MSLFGFGRRKDGDTDDELAIEQRVQAALERLQTTGEPGIGVVAPPAEPAAAAAAAAPAPAVPDAELDYVVGALTSEGFDLERETVARILALGIEFASKPAPPAA